MNHELDAIHAIITAMIWKPFCNVCKKKSGNNESILLVIISILII